VQFVQEDLFKADISGATIVTLYLSPSTNLRLRGKLQRELRPGTRVVSHVYDMLGWTADERLDVEGRWVFFWTVPANR
jgi:hypothetical protein